MLIHVDESQPGSGLNGTLSRTVITRLTPRDGEQAVTNHRQAEQRLGGSGLTGRSPQRSGDTPGSGNLCVQTVQEAGEP